MAREIEKYLISKFQKRLETIEKTGNGSKRIPLFGEFNEIRTLLQDCRISTPTQSADSPIPLAREKLYHLNDMLSECEMLSTKHGLHSPRNLLEIRNITIKLSKIKAELKKALSGSNNNAKVSPEANEVVSSSCPTPLDSAEVIDRSKVHGFDERLAYLKRLVLNDEARFSSIAIVGDEGLGKTTLCKMLFDEPDIKAYFLPRIWISMPIQQLRDHCREADMRTELVVRLLKCLGVGNDVVNTAVSDSEGLSGLLFALYQELVGKRYLIVLDDFRERDVEWYGLKKKNKKSSGGFSLGFGGNWGGGGLESGLPEGWGGAVVVTSRSENAAKSMVGEENVCHMVPLTGCDSCWNIFLDSAGRGRLPLSPMEEEELKKDVEERCGGVPLGAKIMGEAMLRLLSTCSEGEM